MENNCFRKKITYAINILYLYKNANNKIIYF